MYSYIYSYIRQGPKVSVLRYQAAPRTVAPLSQTWDCEDEDGGGRYRGKSPLVQGQYRTQYLARKLVCQLACSAELRASLSAHS